ncbi:MAG: hypothetical protein HY906_09250 [Deltaproteobacteria bacterium]|nr:hypothetical protein [Deltaproteobacteria bacterium]
MRGLLAVGICMSAAMTTPRVARACGPMPEHSPGGIRPSDSETNVPTNTRLWLRYGGYDALGTSYAAETDVVLRPVGGDPLAVTVTRDGEQSSQRLIIVQPDAELLPQTAYEVQTRFKPDCYFDCVQDTYGTVATFTTGGGADLSPPDFAGLSGFSTRPEICTSDSCCGPYKAVRLSLSWTYDPVVATYRIYRDGTFVNPGGLTSGALDCGNFPGAAFATFHATSGSYTMHAVSLAGIEDTNTTAVQVTLDCQSVYDALADAGVDGSHRADGSADGGAAGDASGGGCVAATAAARVGPALLILLLVGARVFRPRRR